MKMKMKAQPRNVVLQARVDTAEMEEILAKSRRFSRGNVSEYVRTAALNYRPAKKIKGGE